MTKSSSPSPEDVARAEQQIVDQSKRIEFYITEYSVELLAEKLRTGDFVIPSYQREFTWEPTRKSRFIESLIMGLPIPFLFFWEMPDGKLEVVDGSQRLRTIREFLDSNFQLGELEQLANLTDFRFDNLPESRQRKIRNRSIRGIVLNEHADEAARLDMFDRINTGSKVANKAEIRRGALSGPFLELVIALAKDDQFVRLTPMSDKSVRERGREELVSRFFAYGDGLDDYHDRPADFVFDYSKKMNREFSDDPNLSRLYRERLKVVMEFVERVFPVGFKKASTSNSTPRARFEAIAIGSYEALTKEPALADKSKNELRVDGWINSGEFLEVTGSDGANAIARLRRRIRYVESQLVSDGHD